MTYPMRFTLLRRCRGEDDDEEAMTEKRFSCGTRAVVKTGSQGFQVVCATCGTASPTIYSTYSAALTAAVRTSNRRCHSCGAS